MRISTSDSKVMSLSVKGGCSTQEEGRMAAPRRVWITANTVGFAAFVLMFYCTWVVEEAKFKILTLTQEQEV